MFGADLLDDLQRAHALAVLHEADRARQGQRPGERVAEALQPFLEDRIVGGEDATRALEDPLPRARGEGEGGEVVGRARGSDGRVVVARPRLGGELRRGDEPADPQAREPVRLGQTVDANQLVIASPEGRRRLAVALGAGVHLVGEQPRPHLLGALENQAAHLL